MMGGEMSGREDGRMGGEMGASMLCQKLHRSAHEYHILIDTHNTHKHTMDKHTCPPIHPPTHYNPSSIVAVPLLRSLL